MLMTTAGMGIPPPPPPPMISLNQANFYVNMQAVLQSSSLIGLSLHKVFTNINSKNVLWRYYGHIIQ